MLVISDQRHTRALVMPALDADMTMQPLVPSAAVGSLTKPLGICIHAARYVVIADSLKHRVAVFDADTNTWSSFDAGGTLIEPRSVASDGAGGLLVADSVRVVRVEDITGAGLIELLPPLAERRPLAVAARNAMEIDVATADGALQRTLDGGATWTSIPLAGSRPVMPSAIARGPSGPTYVCDLANGRVLAVADDASVTTLLDAAQGVVLPTSCAIGADMRDLYVVDTAANRVRRFALDGSRVEPAEYVNGRRADGTFRFDQVGGIAEGTFR